MTLLGTTFQDESRLLGFLHGGSNSIQKRFNGEYPSLHQKKATAYFFPGQMFRFMLVNEPSTSSLLPPQVLDTL